MNRDTFWDNIRDIFFISLKAILCLSVAQILIMVSGSEIKLPLIYSNMMKVFNWWKETFSGVSFGI